MSDTTTEQGVLNAIVIVKDFFDSLECETQDRTVGVLKASYAVSNALRSCELSNEVAFQFSDAVMKAFARYEIAVGVLNRLRDELKNAERDAILKKERERKRRAGKNRSVLKKSLKTSLVAVSWLAFGAVPAYWDDFRLCFLLVVPAGLHYLFFSDSKPVQWLRDLLKFAPRRKSD